MRQPHGADVSFAHHDSAARTKAIRDETRRRRDAKGTPCPRARERGGVAVALRARPAHRLIAHFVFVDMTYNHISARLPGEPEHFLVKADNVFMEQVTASNLVKYDVDGNQVMEFGYKASPAAYNLHAAVLKARPDIVAAVH